MSSTPDQFLEFAVSAHQNAAGLEFNYRNAASRAYYAAFHCCNAERSRYPSLAGDVTLGSHDHLYARIKALPDSNTSRVLKSMAYIALMMKDVRRNADYLIANPFSFEDSAQQIADAKKILQKWKLLQTL